MIPKHPTLTELLETWHQWSYRDLLLNRVTAAEAGGDMVRAEALRRAVDGEPAVDPLDALAANRELTTMLMGWQWHAIRAARQNGASWDRIGAVLGCSPQQAVRGFRDRIERAERHGAGLTDLASYRAVLDDHDGERERDWPRPQAAVDQRRSGRRPAGPPTGRARGGRR